MADRSVALPLLCLLSFALLQSVTAQGTTNLTLAVFLSGLDGPGDDEFTGDLDGLAFQAAVDLALERANNRSDVLPEYTLGASYQDGQCQQTSSVMGLIDQILQESTQIMIIGSDCSTSTEPIAELAPSWNLVQISPLSTSPQLSDNDRFPTFLRLVPSDQAVVTGVLSLMARYDWTRIAIIQQQEFIFTSISTALREAAEGRGFPEPREFTFNTGESPDEQVDRLYDSPTRIIVLNVYPKSAVEILCRAQGLGMTQRNGYLWLTFAWYPKNWWTTSTIPPSCDRANLEEIVEYSLAVDHFPYMPEGECEQTTDSGLSRCEFDNMLNSSLDSSVDRSFASFVYDTVWTAALALQAAAKRLKRDGFGYQLSNFSYNVGLAEGNITAAIYEEAVGLNFSGLTGKVKFTETGDRLPHLRYFQYKRRSGQLERVLVGTEEGDFLPEGEIFPFGTPKDERYVRITLALFVLYTILACLGIVLSIACLFFTVTFWTKRAVQQSSPVLTVVMVVGVILLFVDVVLFGVDEEVASRSTVCGLCMARVWIASLAFSLVVGPVVVKTWRVSYIHSTTKGKQKSKGKAKVQTPDFISAIAKKLVYDWTLLGLVLCLCAIDVVFLIFVTAFSSSRLQLEDKELSSDDNDRSLPQIISVCDADDRNIWLSVLLVYKALLLLWGLFLAFDTRKVNLKHLGDSRRLAASIYVLSFLCLALTVINLLLEDFVDAQYAVSGAMIMLGAVFMLCLIYLRQVYKVSVELRDTEDMPESTGQATSSESVAKETIAQLEQEETRLRAELEAERIRIGHAVPSDEKCVRQRTKNEMSEASL